MLQSRRSRLIASALLIAAGLVILSHPSRQHSHLHPIDQGTINWARSLKKGESIAVRSGGGDADASIEVGEILQNKQINVSVVGFCMSACASILLPAANSVTFVNMPIIGFHQDGLLFRGIVSGDKDMYCNSERAAKMQNIYRKANLNAEFWRETARRLQFKNPRVKAGYSTREGACPGWVADIEYYMWMPTSEQLRTLLGLRFDGLLCADVAECVNGRMKRHFGRNIKIIVGDKVIVT